MDSHSGRHSLACTYLTRVEVSDSSNTLAYFNVATIMTVKYFIAQAPCLIKLGIGELEGVLKSL